MRKPEQRLWDRMRSNVTRLIRLERIENMVTEGMPDTIALHKGAVSFVELKAVREPPKRATTRLLPVGKGLSVDQRNWHMDWTQHGGTSYVLIACGSKWLAMVAGSRADDVNTATMAELEVMSCAGDWRSVEQMLWNTR